MSKKIVLLVLAALLLIGAVTASAQDVLKIGVLTDLSTGLAFYGVELVNGFQLGLVYAAGLDPADYASIDEALAAVTIGGRPIEILIRDTASDPEVGASQARELIEQEGVEILVGAPSSGVVVGLQQVALDYNTILFAAPGASPAITGANFNVNTFRVCRNTFQDFAAFAAYATESLGNEFVILAADYDFGRSSAEAAVATYSAAGITFPVDTIYAPLETTDFTQYIQQILDSGADVLVPIWAGETAIPMYQQFDEMGVRDQMTVLGAFNSNDIVKLAATPANLGDISWIVYHYTLPETEINDWLVEKHQAVYADVPDLFTECAFATAQALTAAVEGTAGDTTPEALIPQLEGMTFDGPKGEYIIRPGDHQALVPMYIVQLDNLDDPDFKFYALLQEVDALTIAPPCLAPEDRCAMNEEFMASLGS
ncbi:MAG: substrate-binding domain-containing protein [Anaerolineae bacterium]|nr:substrate-binding domain-containing protein [Anaerolineae bacterium]